MNYPTQTKIVERELRIEVKRDWSYMTVEDIVFACEYWKVWSRWDEEEIMELIETL